VQSGLRQRFPPPPLPYLLIATFEYDARNRRIRATYCDTPDNIADDALYYYEGQRVAVLTR